MTKLKFEDIKFKQINLEQAIQDIKKYSTYYSHQYSIRKVESYCKETFPGNFFSPYYHLTSYFAPLKGRITKVEKCSPKTFLLYTPNTKDAFGKNTCCFGSPTVDDISSSSWEKWSRKHTKNYPEFSIFLDNDWEFYKSENGIIKLDSSGMGANMLDSPPFLETIVPQGLEIVVGDYGILEINAHIEKPRGNIK